MPRVTTYIMLKYEDEDLKGHKIVRRSEWKDFIDSIKDLPGALDLEYKVLHVKDNIEYDSPSSYLEKITAKDISTKEAEFAINNFGPVIGVFPQPSV